MVGIVIQLREAEGDRILISSFSKGLPPVTAGYRVEWGEESSGTSCVHTLMEASLNSEVKYVHQHTHLDITIVYTVDDIHTWTSL